MTECCTGRAAVAAPLRAWMSKHAGGAFRIGVVALGICVLASTPVSAQSFLDMLFGGGPSVKPQRSAPTFNARPSANFAFPRTTVSPASRAAQPSDDGDADGDETAGRSSRGRFRTVCVRLCDGYYWPVSFATSRARFGRDAGTCRSSCGDTARLFYMPSPSGDIEDAVDLTGRSYARLDTAFKYRKSLVAGCACRPDPWSVAERSRHASYAANEDAETNGAGAEGRNSKGTPITIIAGNYDRPAAATFAGASAGAGAGAAVGDGGTLAMRAQTLQAPTPPAAQRAVELAARAPAPMMSGPVETVDAEAAPRAWEAARTPRAGEATRDDQHATPRRPVTASVADGGSIAARSRAGTQPTAKRRVVVRATSAPPGFGSGFFGLGAAPSGAYVWPGDRPRGR